MTWQTYEIARRWCVAKHHPPVCLTQHGVHEWLLYSEGMQGCDMCLSGSGMRVALQPFVQGRMQPLRLKSALAGERPQRELSQCAHAGMSKGSSLQTLSSVSS